MFHPDFSEKIIQIEKKVLETNPLFNFAKMQDADYFKELKQQIESINEDLKNMNQEILFVVKKNFMGS